MVLLLGLFAQILLFVTIINSYEKDIRKMKIELEYANCYLGESEEEVKKLKEKVRLLDSVSQTINSRLMKHLEEKAELEKDIAWFSNENNELKKMLKENMSWRREYIIYLENEVEKYAEQIAILKDQVKVISDLNDGVIEVKQEKTEI